MNTKQKAVIAYLVIFFVGLLAGMMISNRVFQSVESSGVEYTEERRGGERFGWQRQRSERPERGSIGSFISRRLNLDVEQEEHFIEQLEKYHVDVRQTIFEQREKEKEVILQKYLDFREEVAELLNEEQLQQLDTIVHPDSVRSSGIQRMRGSGRPGR